MTDVPNPNRVIWIDAQPQRPLCDVPWFGTSVVLSDGNVNFCCYSSAVVGNVNVEPFEQIWNGAAMRRIRQTLSEQRLPPECQSQSCPIYRGDELHGIFERMEGPNSFKATRTYDPHASVRERLQGSELRLNQEELRKGDTLEVSLKFHYQGQSMVADLFVGIRYPDGVIRFLPNFAEYAVPFRSHVEFGKDRVPLQFRVFKQRLDSSQAEGEYQICAALFESNSNPNLLSNCYWSANKTFNLKTQKNRHVKLRTMILDNLRRSICKTPVRPHHVHKLHNRIKDGVINLLHQLQLIRLRAERLSIRMFGRGTKRRIMATACWSFPIYSQTFVYQELTQLILHGFNVRFLYSKLNSRNQIPAQFTPLWRVRRRLILHPSVCKRDYAYFQKRMPEKIEKLVAILCHASGMLLEDLRNHHHFLQAFSFTRMVEAYQPDYLHSYFFYEGSLFTLIASYLLDIPRGVSCYADHMLKDYVLKVVPLHLERCDVVIATSHNIKQELLNIASQVDPNRIIVKPNAINTAKFPIVNVENPENGQSYQLICVSRIEPKKGLLYLVEAVRSLRDRDFNVELHLIGVVDDSDSSKNYARELDARIEELNLDGIIHLEGRKSESDIKRFFRISHVFVAPFVETESGDKDGIPTSLLEAMASGLPVVATDAGSICEVIDDGRDGILVPQRDSNALAIAIAELLNNLERRTYLGKNAAQKVREKFDVTVCDHIFHNHLSKILACKREGLAVEDKMRKKPLVSGIIIFLNGENFIQEAIESVLAQTYDHWELLLVDDGSTDRSTEIAVRYAAQHPDKIRYLEHDGHQNRGKSPSRNLGLYHTKGEYIAFLDHDDVWLPNKLEEQVAILEARPEAGMMYGRTRYWHSWTGRPEDRERDGFTALGIQPDTLVKPPHLVTLFLRDERTIASTCSVLIRREVAECVGGFDETFRDQYEDMVFFAKVYLEVPVFVVDGCWDCYRQHPDNSSSIALRTSKWHPKRLNPTREMFLNWLEQHISEKGVTDAELLEALRTELWPYRHPEERTPSQKFYDVCLDAGLVLGRGEDARPLLRALGDVRDPGLDGHAVAEWLFDAVPLSTGRAPSVWVELWPRLEQRIEEFLGVLEVQVQAAGLAREARRVLECMIEGKWWLRVAGGNVANLVFPPNDPDMVRIAIEKVETKTSFDIQLNLPHLKVKSNHPYTVNFRARADSPRSIILGFAKAHEPWTGLGLYSKIKLTNEWQSFEEDFVATADDDNARIHFDIGDSDISVEVTSVRLRSIADGESIEPDIPRMQTARESAVGEQTGEAAGREDMQGSEMKGATRRIHGLGRLRQAARQFRNRFDRKVLILMYHRVAEVQSDPWSLCVTPQHFGEHLEVLRKHARPIGLMPLVRGLGKGHFSRRAVVVTFDDGYADNLHNAKPLLERYDIPATVFLTTGYIGHKREFWWDELDRLFLQPGTLPEVLKLSINGSAYEWKLGEAAHYSEDAHRRNRYRRAWEDAPGSRHSLYFSLWQLLQPLPEDERRKMLDELLVWAGTEPVVRPTHRSLSFEEVLALAQGELVEVGSHTVTHSLLSALSLSEQREEIQRSKVHLEEVLGRPVTSFAYPYSSYTAETVTLVRQAGFACACSTSVGVIGQNTDYFQLPRVDVLDWNGEEFARQLSIWFNG